MLTPINRKELYITFSMEKQSKIRELLEASQIPYKLKLVNRNSPSVMSTSRGRTGTLGQNAKLFVEYIFYVSKPDYEKAKHLVGQLDGSIR